MTNFNNDDQATIIEPLPSSERLKEEKKGGKKKAKKGKSGIIEDEMTNSQKELQTMEKQRVLMVLRPYLLCDIKNLEGIEINDEFWLSPEFNYWPTPKLMKQLVTIASQAESQFDIHF